jgi:hypothetical protein
MRVILGLKLLLFSIILFQASLYAQNQASLLQTTGSLADYPGSHVLTVFDKTKVDVEESGLGYFTIHQLFKVLDEKGALQMRTLKYGYEPMSARLQIEKVFIYRQDGRIEQLEKNRVYDYPAPGSMILWGAREQMADIGWLEPGDAVEILIRKKGYTYALLQNDEDNERYIPPMRGHYYDIVPFWSSQHVLEKSYRIWLPKSKKLNYKVFQGEIEVELSVGGDKQGFSFVKRNIEPMEIEPGMLAPSDVFTKLIMTTAPDWESKSKWFYRVNEDFGSFESTPAIDKKVNEILSCATDELDSISRLNHWVADNIRYFGLNMGEGEGYTLHKADMTFTDRCGVCKDKAGMLVCMLRAAGFESYAAMTMAGSRIEDIPADQFNHSVTAVRLRNGEFMMLDPTWVPFVRENWSSREQQQNYIIGTKEGEDLSIIPVSDAENHYYRLSGYSIIRPDSSLKGSIVLTAEGQSDAAFRGQLTRSPYAEWEKIISNELYRKFPKIIIEKISFSDGYDYSKPFKIEVRFLIPDYLRAQGKVLLFQPVASANLFERMNYHMRLNTNLVDRKFPFRDACSKKIYIEDRIEYPDKFQLLLPSDAKNVSALDNEAAKHKVDFKVFENGLQISTEIELSKRIYEADDWEAVRAALLAQKQVSEKTFFLTPKL